MFTYYIATLSFLSLKYSNNEENTQKWKTNAKVIIDIDPGIDDIEGLAILINEHNKGNLELVGIVISEGNTPQPNGTENAFRLLTVTNAMQIPLFEGSRMPILPHHEKLENYFGLDGFADLSWTWTPNVHVQEDIAPVAIKKLVDKYPKQIIYITLGPMTNLGLAMRMFEGVVTNLREIYAMGGSARNDSMEVAEFNIGFDPESAEIVLDELQCPMTLFTWEACSVNAPLRTWLQNLTLNNPVFAMVKRAEDKLTAMQPENSKWTHCDPETVIALIREDAILKSFESPLKIQLDSGMSRGVISNFTGSKENRRHPIRVITEFDMQIVEDVFLRSFDEICQFNLCNLSREPPKHIIMWINLVIISGYYNLVL